MARSRGWLLVSVLFGLFASNLTFTVFNVALVSIARNLHTTSSTLTWAITGPLLAIGVSAPVLGKTGDIRGHRRLYLAGLVGSLCCAALTAVAWNATSLIVARLFSGLGSACLTASSWAILFRVFGPGERTKVLGWWSLVGAGGPVIGVAIGGPVVQAFGWRWIFIAQIPLIVAALMVNWRGLPETDRSPGEALDVPGALLLAIGVGALLFAVNQGSRGWSRPLVMISVPVAVVALAGFVLVERRARSPVFPLSWLSNREFVLPCVAASAINFAYMGGFFLTPLFLEQGLGYGIGAAGFFQIARPLAFAVASPTAGYLAFRTGERAVAVAGATLLGASMLVFSVLRPGDSAVLIVVALAASGLANGVSTPAVSAMVAATVEPNRMGSASGAVQVASQMGVVTGIQVMETIQVARHHTVGVVQSYQDAYLVGAVFTVVAVVAAWMIRSARRPVPAVVPAELA
ncbi:MAG: MFS transporter [Acidimicrobiales bacterium]|nr:MFS transporter [Acidimicrobiales bacterium]